MYYTFSLLFQNYSTNELFWPLYIFVLHVTDVPDQVWTVYFIRVALSVSFVQLSQWDPLTQQPGFPTPQPWQDLTHIMVKTTNHHLHHTLWSIHSVVITTTLQHLNNWKVSACQHVVTPLPSQSSMTCLCLRVKQTWQPSSRWCSCLTLA